MVPAQNQEIKIMATVLIGNNYDASDIEATLIDAPLWWHDRGLEDRERVR